MAESLQVNVVAEGVETQEQMQFLRQKRCGEAQGYLISRPLPADDLTTIIGNHPHGSPSPGDKITS
jgi:EAL domain-containing protein (putative c-di-GMP-specific phosphodiesterase class I)